VSFEPGSPNVLSYFSFLQNAIVDQQIEPEDDSTLVDAFLDAIDCEVPPGLTGKIDSGDIVEIHSEDFVQIYRNRRFFEFCTYDLDTVLTTPFDVLFRRDQEIMGLLFQRAVEVIQGLFEYSYELVPKHKMQEHFSGSSTLSEIQLKLSAPFRSRKTGKYLGFFTTQAARPIGKSNVQGIGFVPKI